MSERNSASLAAPGAHGDVNRFLDLMAGYAIPRCLQAVADFDVADALGDAPATAAELAAKVGLDADALARVLCFLTTAGVFEEVDGRFRHTAFSRLLRSDHPLSQKGYMRILRLNWLQLAAFDHSLRTGRATPEALAPGGLWGWLRANPDLAAIFDGAMASYGGANVAALLKAYDFSGLSSIADIGGGQGHLLRAILAATPDTVGVLFDQPAVIESVRSRPVERMRLLAGDFFKDALPPRCDAYCLMSVIHDWDDAQSIAILKNVRQAAAPHGRLLLIEMLLPETPLPGYVGHMDIAMLMITGGRERRRSEYERLLAASGWRAGRVVPTDSPMSVLEAVAT